MVAKFCISCCRAQQCLVSDCHPSMRVSSVMSVIWSGSGSSVLQIVTALSSAPGRSLSAASEHFPPTPRPGAWKLVDCSPCLLWSLETGGIEWGKGLYQALITQYLYFSVSGGPFLRNLFHFLVLSNPPVFFFLDFHSSKAANWTKHFSGLSHSCNSKDKMPTCFN